MTNRRNSGQRRVKSSAHFPLIDCDRNTVTTERRLIPDRRLANVDYAQRLFLYAEMPAHRREDID